MFHGITWRPMYLNMMPSCQDKNGYARCWTLDQSGQPRGLNSERVGSQSEVSAGTLVRQVRWSFLKKKNRFGPT